MESTFELSPVERDRLLDERCAGDPALRSEVESLLRAYDAGGTLDEPAFDLGRIAAGDWIGPYRILDELGHGGMGSVYLGQPEDGEDERIAVKVAHHGLPRHAWQRVRTEYRILQGLDHPGIARVLDAGATDDGRPYFVMEYIEGTRIDEYCSERELSVSARLELVVKVCDVVDTVHRQGVVHRDLKPSNILVTPNGEPKLLDFGIAKLLEPEALSFTVESTRTHEQCLTLQYASPEQIRGETITPRTDIYSLGVVLYKLLTGRLPYLLKRYTLVAMEHAFEEQSPQRLHAIAADPGFADLKGDLDSKIMKALSVKVEKRFETMGDFARALRKSLLGQPSTAEIALGRLRRLCFAARRRIARQRGAVYAWALAVVIVVVLGVSVTSIDGPRADIPAADLSFSEHDRIVVGDFRNLTGEPILNDSLELAFRFGFESSTYVRTVSREYLRHALEGMDRDPELGIGREAGIEIGRRLGAKALVLGGAAKVEGRYRVFAELIETASGLERLTTSAEAANQDDLVVTLQKVCDDIRLHLGENPEIVGEKGRLGRVISTKLPALRAYSLGLEGYGKSEYESALGFFERAITVDPDFALAHTKLASALWNLGQRDGIYRKFTHVAQLADRLTHYERLYVRARLAYLDGTLKESMDAWTSMIHLYPEDHVAYFNLSTVLTWQAYDPEQSARVLEEALSRVPARFKNVFLSRLSLNYLTLDRPREYESTIQRFAPQPRRTRQLRAILLGPVFNRSDRQAQTLLKELQIIDAASVQLLALAYNADYGRLQQIDRFVKNELSDASYSLDSACLMEWISIQLGRSRLQKDYLQELLEGFTSILSNQSDGKNFIKIQSLAIFGKFLARNGAVSEAEAISVLLKLFVESNRFPFWTSFGLVLEGEILAAKGRYSEAVRYFQEALEAQETFQAHDSLAEAYMRQGTLGAAVRESDWLVAHRGRALFEDSSFFVRAQNVISWHYARLRLARLHERSGRRQEAVEHYRRFLDNWRDGDRPPVWHDAHRRVQVLLAELER